MAKPPDSPFTRTDEALLPVLRELMAWEPIFHRPEVASGLDDFDRLMAPGYWEVGASGRRYSRAFILQWLGTQPPADARAEGWRIEDPQCQQLAPDIFLFTYTLHQGERITRRATLWRRASGTFQILYHQGTIVTAEEDDTAPPAEVPNLPEPVKQ